MSNMNYHDIEIYVTEEEYEKLYRISEKNDTTIAEIAHDCLMEYLNKFEADNNYNCGRFMKARVRRASTGLYYGEVYVSIDIPFFSEYSPMKKRYYWEDVTGPCITSLGCKMALRRWKASQDTEPEEFDI